MTAIRKTALWLTGVAVFMVGMAFASVPLYDLFCRVTGYGGTTQVAGEASEQADTQTDKWNAGSNPTVDIRFAASTAAGMPWEFRPVQLKQTIRIGESALAFYEAYNPTSRAITGTATFNVTPFSTGGYFTKIDCFCFQEQTLQPGERALMPVSYYIDPEIVEDEEAVRAHTITLNYTFFETEPEPGETSINKAATDDAATDETKRSGG